ncbi:hypothetical protein [Psychrobacillus antarcticus]|uniref:hypothetical protein n=1 Tax=Psychrobacillus antarcticus TaxID=2879115 RepID=UPI0024081349|nr:hypothetical protein [Psychrobacillus antarcticus]
MRHHIDAQATVMAHRSPRGTGLPETEISSIIHSLKSHEFSVHGTFLYTFLSLNKG